MRFHNQYYQNASCSQVQAKSDEGKTEFKTTKLVKTKMTFPVFVSQMRDDVSDFTRHIIVMYWQKNITQGKTTSKTNKQMEDDLKNK